MPHRVFTCGRQESNETTCGKGGRGATQAVFLTMLELKTPAEGKLAPFEAYCEGEEVKKALPLLISSSSPPTWISTLSSRPIPLTPFVTYLVILIGSRLERRPMFVLQMGGVGSPVSEKKKAAPA